MRTEAKWSKAKCTAINSHSLAAIKANSLDKFNDILNDISIRQMRRNSHKNKRDNRQKAADSGQKTADRRQQTEDRRQRQHSSGEQGEEQIKANHKQQQQQQSPCYRHNFVIVFSLSFCTLQQEGTLFRWGNLRRLKERVKGLLDVQTIRYDNRILLV